MTDELHVNGNDIDMSDIELSTGRSAPHDPGDELADFAPWPEDGYDGDDEPDDADLLREEVSRLRWELTRSRDSALVLAGIVGVAALCTGGGLGWWLRGVTQWAW